MPDSVAARGGRYALCSQLAQTHSLEGPECLSLAANKTESHDIGVRWLGVDLMRRLVRRPKRDDIGGEAGGGAFNRSGALLEMSSRLRHWQPGTRWMAVYGVRRVRSEPIPPPASQLARPQRRMHQCCMLSAWEGLDPDVVSCHVEAAALRTLRLRGLHSSGPHIA